MESKFKIKDIFPLLKQTFKEWMIAEPFDLAAVIAFYAIFSLPGLLLIVVTLAGLAFGPDAVQGRISDEITSMMGKEAGRGIENMVANAYRSENSLIATIIGIATVLFGATGVLVAMKRALNRVWEVRPDPEKTGIMKVVMDRVLSLGLILVVGFLMLISLVISTLISSFRDWILSILPDFLYYLFFVVNILISFGVIMLLFALLYKYLPDVKLKWRTVWTGAAVTALLFVAGKFVLSLYFGNAEPASTYGAAGSVILLLLWVSYSGLIFFFGAEFTKVYGERYHHPVRPTEKAITNQEYYRRTGRKD